MAKLLKNLHNKEYMTFLAHTIAKHHQSFDKDNFIDTVFNKDWENKELKFSFVLSSLHDLGNLRVEYIIDFVRQNNKYSKKVFQIAQGNYTLKTKEFKKSYSFKPISTRKYYSCKWCSSSEC